MTPNEAFARVRSIIPMYCDAVVIYGRSSTQWHDDRRRAEEISFAFHDYPSMAEAAACEAMKYQHCDWFVVFERRIETVCYGVPGGGGFVWVVRIAAGVDK